MMLVLSISSLSISGFAMMNYDVAFFLETVCCLAVYLFAFECLAQFVALHHNPLAGMLFHLTCWVTMFLFAGLFLRISDIIWPFQVISYIVPTRYILSLSMYFNVKDRTFGEAAPCDPGVSPTNSSAMCLAGGFICDADIPPSQCFGYTGSQVLSALSVQYEFLSTAPSVGKELAIMLAFAAVWKTAFAILLQRQCLKVQLPKAPRSTPASKVPEAQGQMDDVSSCA
eukprot:7390220-Prymnesium_polylepis.2